MLTSADYRELAEPGTKGKRHGPRDFRVAAPTIWNNPPSHLPGDDFSCGQLPRVDPGAIGPVSYIRISLLFLFPVTRDLLFTNI